MRNFYARAAVVALTLGVGSGANALTTAVAEGNGTIIGGCTVTVVANPSSPLAQVRIAFTTVAGSNFGVASVTQFLEADWNTTPTKIANECGVSSESIQLTDPTGKYAETESFGITYTAAGVETFAGIVEAPVGMSLKLTSDPATEPANEFTVTATFGEAVTNFDASDVSVTNGSVKDFDGSADEYTFVVTPSSDGEVTVEIAADAATAVNDGELKSVAASLTLTGDVTAPSGYSVALDQDTINSDNEYTVSFTFAGAEVDATYEYTISSSGGGTDVTGPATVTTIGSADEQITGIDVSGLEDGTLTLSVTLTDPAGNEGAAAEDTATKDATAPTGHSVSFTQSGVNAGNETAIGFKITDAEDVDYSYTISSDGGGTDVTGRGQILDGSAEVTNLDLSDLGDGTLTLSVVLTDGAGNAATAVEDRVSKDGLAPAAPNAPTLADSSNSGITTDTLTNDTTATITGTAEANATVTVYAGTTEAGTTSADGSGNWSFTFDEGDLASGTNSITVTATDAAGNTSQASSALVITLDTGAPTVTLTGPTDVVTENFTVTFTFSENVTDFTADDVTVTNGTKGTFAGSGKTYTLVVTPELGKTVTVAVAADVAQDAAGNGNTAATTFEVQAGSVASEFEKEEESIKEDIVKDVQQSLQNAVTANVRLVREAKSRFIASRSSVGGYAGSNNVPFDVDGTAVGTAMRLSTNGTFFGQVGSDDGKARRVFFGDFSINGERNGSVTASISGKVAWERQITDMTMYGYFIGGEVNQTDIKTTFTGQQQGYGLNLGAYAVSEVQEDVFLDGFLSVGVGRSELDMSNDVLNLDGDYQTQSVTLGGALTGVYDMETYELWPEIAFTVGRTQIGNADFTGRAYGLVDNTLTLDAGDVTVANLTLRPEVRVPISESTDSAKMAQWTFAPRVICERIVTDTTVENCGRGAEVGFVSRSADGMTNVTGRVMRDNVGSSTRTGLELKLQHRF